MPLAPCSQAPAAATLYRSRRPELTASWRVVRDHRAALLEQWATLFAPTRASLRTEIAATLWAFVKCGLPELGCAKARCEGCGETFLVAFSCRTRGFCPSCGAKRAESWSRWMVERVVRPVPHRQLVLTIPKILRRAFVQDPKLLRELARAGAHAIRQVLRAVAPRERDAMVVAIQSFGSLLGAHPHLHVVMADGVFDERGRFRRLPSGWARAVEHVFRERVFALLSARGWLKPSTAARMRAWKHSGFQAHSEGVVDAGDREGLRRLLRYVARPPFEDARLTYRSEENVAIYRGPRIHPGEGGNFLALEPLQWLARAAMHVPPARRHTMTC